VSDSESLTVAVWAVAVYFRGGKPADFVPAISHQLVLLR